MGKMLSTLDVTEIIDGVDSWRNTGGCNCSIFVYFY